MNAGGHKDLEDSVLYTDQLAHGSEHANVAVYSIQMREISTLTLFVFPSFRPAFFSILSN